MEAAEALAHLSEISSQIDAVVLASAGGDVVASTVDDEGAARLADGARRLLEEAAATGRGAVAQLEAATPRGSVFVVRDGERLIAALTGPDPTVGLVFYDLKTCLRETADAPKPKARRPRGKAEEPADGA